MRCCSIHRPEPFQAAVWTAGDPDRPFSGSVFRRVHPHRPRPRRPYWRGLQITIQHAHGNTRAHAVGLALRRTARRSRLTLDPSAHWRSRADRRRSTCNRVAAAVSGPSVRTHRQPGHQDIGLRPRRDDRQPTDARSWRALRSMVAASKRSALYSMLNVMPSASSMAAAIHSKSAPVLPARIGVNSRSGSRAGCMKAFW